MSYKSIAVCAGLLVAMVGVSGAPVSAQIRSAVPVRMAKRPNVGLAPRTYTAATFRARVSSLRGGEALLARVNTDRSHLTPSTSVPASGSASSGSAPSTPANTQPNTVWNSGIGAIGAVTTISITQPQHGGGDHDGYLELGATGVDFEPSSFGLKQSSLLYVYFISGPGSGTTTFLVLFDFAADPSGKYPTVTIGGGATPTTCTAADLQASTSAGVVTCAATISGQFGGMGDMNVTAHVSGSGYLNFVDASFMRVR